MAWERGYYYRVRKDGGKVVRDYYGKGEVAELAAQMDAINRAERDADRAAWRAERDEMEALDAGVEELDELADLLASAPLLPVLQVNIAKKQVNVAGTCATATP
jgi:hypothetical protein